MIRLFKNKKLISTKNCNNEVYILAKNDSTVGLADIIISDTNPVIIIKIGHHSTITGPVMFWGNCKIGHHTNIGAHASIGMYGSIGNYVNIGLNFIGGDLLKIRNKVTIGRDVVIRPKCIINNNCSIGEDISIGDYTEIPPFKSVVKTYGSYCYYNELTGTLIIKGFVGMHSLFRLCEQYRNTRHWRNIERDIEHHLKERHPRAELRSNFKF